MSQPSIQQTARKLDRGERVNIEQTPTGNVLGAFKAQAAEMDFFSDFSQIPLVTFVIGSDLKKNVLRHDNCDTLGRFRYAVGTVNPSPGIYLLDNRRLLNMKSAMPDSERVARNFGQSVVIVKVFTHYPEIVPMDITDNESQLINRVAEEYIANFDKIHRDIVKQTDIHRKIPNRPDKLDKKLMPTESVNRAVSRGGLVNPAPHNPNNHSKIGLLQAKNQQLVGRAVALNL